MDMHYLWADQTRFGATIVRAAEKPPGVGADASTTRNAEEAI